VNNKDSKGDESHGSVGGREAGKRGRNGEKGVGAMEGLNRAFRILHTSKETSRQRGTVQYN
jgi:hypothetical protein